MDTNRAAARTLVQEGQLLLERGRAEEGLERLDRALTFEPTLVDAHLCRGLALKTVRRFEEALAAFDQAIDLDADYVQAHVNRSGILRELGRSLEALESSERALALLPEFAPAHCNRGLALGDLGRLDEALQSYDRAIAIDGAFAAAHGNRGKVLQALDRPEKALAAYERVIALKPGSAQAYLNAGHTQLLLGQFDRGWALYEWRKRLPKPMGARFHAIPAWRGSPLAGKRLLLHWEQGLGDTIQFCRYAKMAAARGAAVTLMVQRNLSRLIRTIGTDIKVRSDEQVLGSNEQAPLDQFDHHCPLLSLPLAFGTRLEDVPADVPYLSAEPDRVVRWREHIGGSGFRIGIHWQGNKQAPADRGRSFQLLLFREIANIPGIRLISLQAGPGREQLQDMPQSMIVEDLGCDFDGGDDAFVDSAAVMQSLDLIITSDAALAHLAGALARPVWVALQHVPDWRWLRDGAQSPWYPTMKLYRQTRRGRWDDVFDAMHAELSSMSAVRRGG